MYKLANQVLDVYDDVTHTDMQKLAKIGPSVDVMSPDARAALNDHDFALVVLTKKASKLCKFPVNDRDATWLSNQYFEMNQAKLPEEAAAIAASHIKEACARHKLPPTPAVEKLAKVVGSNVYVEKDEPFKDRSFLKVARMTEMAEVDQIGSNPTFAQYAFPTSGHIKMACAYFEKHASKMPTEARFKYAAAIQTRAKELGLAPQKGLVAKYASDHYSAAVDAHLRSRASLTEAMDPKFSAALTKLGAMKNQVSPKEFAQLLHGIDKMARLERYYGGYLTNPYEATFAQQPDPMEGYRAKTANQNLTADALARLVTAKYAKIKEHFGAGVADEMKKNPTAIFDSLPKDAQEIIGHIADGVL